LFHILLWLGLDLSKTRPIVTVKTRTFVPQRFHFSKSTMTSDAPWPPSHGLTRIEEEKRVVSTMMNQFLAVAQEIQWRTRQRQQDPNGTNQGAPVLPTPTTKLKDKAAIINEESNLSSLWSPAAFRRAASPALGRAMRLDPTLSLTPQEVQALHRPNYYHYSYGLGAGLGVFVVTLGALRFSSSSSVTSSMLQRFSWRASFQRLRRDYFSWHHVPAPLPVWQQARASAAPGVTQNVSNTRSAPRRLDASSNTPGLPFSLDQDTVSMLQIIFSSGLALIVGVATLQQTMDQTRLCHAVAALPLQPGKSVWCHAACPLLLQQQASVQAWLQEAHTEQLQAMALLVYNCQARQDYIAQKGEYHPDEVVEIPTPGVPLRYIRPTNQQ
jgi:hypothetical protein